MKPKLKVNLLNFSVSSGSDFSFYFHSLLDQSQASRHVEDLGSPVDSIPRNCTRASGKGSYMNYDSSLCLVSHPSLKSLLQMPKLNGLKRFLV